MKLISTLFLLVVSSPLFAGDPAPQVPEPGVLALLGVGAAVGLALAIKRRK